MFDALLVVVAAGALLCAPRAMLAEALTAAFDERLRAVGVMEDDGRRAAVVEIWTGPMSTWSIVVTRADGTSCLVVAGIDWHEPRIEEKRTR